MRRRREKQPHGQLRQSQVVTSFGPGAMFDLPNDAVLLAGLDHWRQRGDEIAEPRLVEKLNVVLRRQGIRLFSPPHSPEDSSGPIAGVAAWRFPQWFVTQDAEKVPPSNAVRCRLLVHRDRLTGKKFIDRDKQKRPVVPIRFVRACRCGHIGDIDWYAFAHGGHTDCRRQLFVDDRGTSGDLGEIWIRCECKVERCLNEATLLPAVPLGICDGGRPWLGPHAAENCGEPNRLLIRSASNAYFAQTMSVISLPDRNEIVRKAVDNAWDFLEIVETSDDLERELRRVKVKAALEGIAIAEVMAELARRRGSGVAAKSVKQAELETLLTSKEEIGGDVPDGTFFARQLPRAIWDRKWTAAIERVVLIHRLREVVAQVGFTRFEAAAPDVNGELQMGVQRAELALSADWLPAIENRGEGVFIQLRTAAIDEWLSRPEVQRRRSKLEEGFNCWKADRNLSKRKFPGLSYVLLHSLSHMLITAVSLECGYPASSIRERIYAIDGIGYGILLYTGTADSEGTLGGLVAIGRSIHEHLRAALRLGELCSNDPVCAQHQPSSIHERRYLHGSACHGCLLIAETSCEQHNEFLDRALVIPTVEGLGAEFFRLEE